MHEFSPETLIISLYEALRHRKTAVTDAGALANTITQLLFKKRQALIPTSEIKRTAFAVLSRFDKTAAAVYKATTS